MGFHVCKYCHSSTDPCGKYCSFCGVELEITEEELDLHCKEHEEEYRESYQEPCKVTYFPEQLHKYELVSGAPYGDNGDTTESYVIYIDEYDVSAFNTFLYEQHKNNYKMQWFDMGRVE
jgi:hypothetical protein